MEWTSNQQKIINVRNNNILVSAAAGSGKTAVLVERIIQKIFDRENPINVDELLVVTFTNAAASQMKEKISIAIEEKIEQEPGNERYVEQLNLMSHSNILTIDSFCYKIVKEYFHVLGIDPKIQIAEDADLAILRQNILEEVIEDAYRNNDFFSVFSDAYSSDKNDMAIEGYILDLYELSESYSYPKSWLVNAKKNLIVASENDFDNMPFVKKYYKDIHNRAECIKRFIMNILEDVRGIDGPKHYEKALLSDIVLVDNIIQAGTYGDFYNIDLKFETLGKASKDASYDKDIADNIKKNRNKYKIKIKKLIEAFSLPFDDIILQYEKQEKVLTSFVDVTMEFADRFLAAKLKDGILGFSDIEHFALKVLCDGKDNNGEPIPTQIAKELSEQYREILIDEYQDSNYLQEDILKCVSTIYDGHNNMFMVGDVKQSIYAFRMARPDLFVGKYNTFKMLPDDGYENIKEDTGVKILLKNNFRSRSSILVGVNYIFSQIMRKELGGIDYGEDEALVPGKIFPPSDNNDVEILIGESKDADYLEVIDSDSIVDDDEHLDDEYIDVSSVELEASMVSDKIKKFMGDGDNDPLLVMDEDNGGLRKINYSDIVIIIRSPKGYQSVFSEILKGNNIPVRVQNEEGYFDTVEIRALLSLLKIIDNPYDDLEYVALLRGYFGCLSNDELAVISIMKKTLEVSSGKMYYYSFVEKIINDDELLGRLCTESGVMDVLDSTNKLTEKCKKVSLLIHNYQELKKLLSVSELLSDIYYNTGYYNYVKAMPEGYSRCRNLKLLTDETRRFEKGGFRSLFDFLQFVKRLSEKGVALGGDPSVDDVENVVRIISAHKSKGLEFPVVFVSGIGKKFNMSDTKSPIIMHADYYINAKYVDAEKRYGYDTFGRRAAASMITAEMIAEEIRILYVALTRAKEKLVITGVTPDIPKLIEKYKIVADSSEEKIDYDVMRNVSSFLDLIVAAMIRNKTFHKAMGLIKPRLNGKGEIISGAYELKNVKCDPNVKFSVRVFDFQSLVVSRIKTGEELGVSRMNRIKLLEKIPSEKLVKLNENLDWIYEDYYLTKEKSKLSVTEIKRKYEECISIIDDSLEGQNEKLIKPNESKKKVIPKFISDKQPMDASVRGTWMHKVMEKINFSVVDSFESAKVELEKLYYKGYLPQETRAFISAEKVYSMLNSSLGKRMRRADICGNLNKERKFVVGVPVSESNDVPNVVVQGIIDAYFEEDGDLVLVDYKTDKIKEGQEDLLIERYDTQMKYYKETLEQLTGLNVKETYLYSFTLDKPIKV